VEEKSVVAEKSRTKQPLGPHDLLCAGRFHGTEEGKAAGTNSGEKLTGGASQQPDRENSEHRPAAMKRMDENQLGTKQI
jgi:hypothetical protein